MVSKVLIFSSDMRHISIIHITVNSENLTTLKAYLDVIFVPNP